MLGSLKRRDGLHHIPALRPKSPDEKAMTLFYPYGKNITHGEVRPLVDGIAWLRLPLRSLFSTAHINVWLVPDHGRWAIFDTGLHDEHAVDFWSRWEEDDECADISQVFVTHMHPDHAGMAGWLTQRFGCALSMTQTEYQGCRLRLDNLNKAVPEAHRQFFRLAGWSEREIQQHDTQSGGLYEHVHRLPDGYRRLSDGDSFEIEGVCWKVITGTGHSPEHACFYSESHQLLISGDQVLPTISSNVSVHPAEPDADPLSGWLESLSRFKRRLPDDVTVLPAHGAPFRGLHQRLDQLTLKREQALDRLRRILAVPCRVVDVFGALFRPPARPVEYRWLMLATGSAIAYLNYLHARGEIRKYVVRGVTWHELI